ncbi:MAG: hypothetical protein MJ210_04930 [Alphaproteobacteria bacterium]|nr:hypothetical protein [Alphaproteobacteria bacterium]
MNRQNNSSFLTLIGRSFKYVFKNKALLRGISPLAAILIIFQLVLGLPFLCAFQDNCPVGLSSTEAVISAFFHNNDINWTHLLAIISLVLGATGIIINYCRTLIIKARVDFLSLTFWKNMGFYLLARVVLDIVVFMLFLAFSFLLIKILNFIHPADFVYISGIFIVLLVSYILAAPIFLAFPAIAVEDFKMLHLKELFASAKGNFNTIFWGQFIITVPYWLFFGMLKEIYTLLPQNNMIIDFVFVSLLVVISLIDACFKGAFFANIYQIIKFDKNLNKNSII